MDIMNQTPLIFFEVMIFFLFDDIGELHSD